MPLGAILILMLAGFCFVLLAMLCWWTLKRRQLREQAGYELQLRLVQTAGGNLEQLLSSEAARGLLPLLQPAAGASARERAQEQIVRSVRWGTVGVCMCVSLLVASAFVTVDRGLVLAGIVGGAAAVGLLLSALFAARLARSPAE